MVLWNKASFPINGNTSFSRNSRYLGGSRWYHPQRDLCRKIPGRQGETNFLTKILPESSLSSDGTSVNIPHNGNKCGVSTNYQPTAQMRMRSCFDASVSPWQLLYRGILCGTEARKLAERGVCAY